MRISDWSSDVCSSDLALADAVAEGAREAGALAEVKRVPELVPQEVAQNAGYKMDQPADTATVAELPNYDAIVIGTPKRFGNMAAQMNNFLDRVGGLWARARLAGKAHTERPGVGKG